MDLVQDPYPGPVPPPTFVLVLNGSYGVGKSAALDHVGDLLAEQGRPFSLLDVDWFHRSWPPAADDPDNVRTEADALAAVWQQHRKVGPRQPVLAGVLASDADRERYARVFGLPVRSVRLVASAAVTEGRLRGRYPAERARALEWHLERHAELTARLARADGDELVLATDALTAGQVAAATLAHVGLLPPGATGGPLSGGPPR